MSEVSSRMENADIEKPANDSIVFPPFPDPDDDDFEDDITDEERNYYLVKFKDLNKVVNEKLHCTACDRHLGCSTKSESRMKSHPMLRTLTCQTCHTFYNSGEFEKGDDGSELYCRWCGQGGQVYCCADCQHVFCAKCIKRNLGTPKIKEIESLDDWKCFKCNPKCLWDLRAVCWALLRFVDIRNKIIFKTENPDLKDKYQKLCEIDESSCCVDRRRRNVAGVKRKHEIKKEKKDDSKKEKDKDTKNATSAIISKIPPTIQVKKFASINMEERKSNKRSVSPRSKTTTMKHPIAIAPFIQPINMLSHNKKPRYLQPTSFLQSNLEKPKYITYAPRLIRPRQPPIQPPMPMPQPPFNGCSPMLFNTDNINLSLESLTQGLDMNQVSLMDNDDVVCTPDFPLETCEEFDDNDDDVQCITPGPVAAPKPPSNTNKTHKIPDLSPENIVQMTDNDVTVNAATGGLKFRVDPQTLSANKMYRLPDGRIFAINPNTAMPGGYSATIVAVSDSNLKSASKGATYSAKVCPVPAKPTATPTPPPPLAKISRINRTPRQRPRKTSQPSKSSDTETRKVDVGVPVEWYRYNLVDAVDSLEYSLKRLRKLKKEATTMFLRSRSVSEMRTLHRSLERVLQTSTTRFSEVKHNLNQGWKRYLANKTRGTPLSDEDDDDDDDDDVEILNDHENDDPIFIDENSMDSNNATKNDCQGIDLIDTSDPNDSVEKEVESTQTSKVQTESTNGLSDQVIASKSLSNLLCSEGFHNQDKNLQNSDPLNKIILPSTQSKTLGENEMTEDQDQSFESEIIQNSINLDESVMSVDENKSMDAVEIDKNDEEKTDEKLIEANKNQINNGNEKLSQEINTTINNRDPEKEVESVDTSKINNNKDEEITQETNRGDKTQTCDELKEVKQSDDVKEKEELDDENTLLQENTESGFQDSKSKIQDADMSDKLIESLLEDDSVDVPETQKDASVESELIA